MHPAAIMILDVQCETEWEHNKIYMASKFQKSSLQYLKYLKFKYHQLFSHIFTGFSPQVQAEKEWHGLLPQRSQGICLKSWRSYWVAKVGLEKIQSRFGTLMMFGSTVMMLMPGSMDIMLVMMFMQMTLLRMMLLLMIMMRRPTSLHNRWSQADTVILYISVYIYISFGHDLWMSPQWTYQRPTVIFLATADTPTCLIHQYGVGIESCGIIRRLKLSLTDTN